MTNKPQVPQLTVFHRTAMLAHELNSPNCINWHALEVYLQKHGKEQTLAQIAEEMTGANNVYMAHLNLAYSRLKEID